MMLSEIFECIHEVMQLLRSISEEEFHEYLQKCKGFYHYMKVLEIISHEIITAKN